MQEESTVAADLIKDPETGKFLEGKSGNPMGRPRGSRNKVTLMKLVAEQAVREGNYEKMIEVAEKIIESALKGNSKCRKMVWDSIMSKGAADDTTTAKEKVQININAGEAPVVERVQIDQESEEDESESN